jgi:iron complex outermembrane recepter protein
MVSVIRVCQSKRLKVQKIFDYFWRYDNSCLVKKIIKLKRKKMNTNVQKYEHNFLFFNNFNGGNIAFRFSISAALFLLMIMQTGACFAEQVNVEMDEVTVTATRLERKTSEVAASVAVINKNDFEDSKQFNVKEMLDSTPGVLIESSNQGYDSRLIIRGAGLKAPYGVREIMVLRDGVPVTDPDSFTRLDMIDPQLIERIEVVKGPNSTMWGANAAGGVINIISKNPLDQSGGILRVAGGENNSKNLHASYSDHMDSKFFYSASLSWRETDNSWRRWNEFSTVQVSFQPNFVLSDNSSLENMISYSKADLQLPGSLNETQFMEYLRTGKAKETDGPWQYSGRYSKSYYFSSKLTKKMGDLELIPMLYYNIWEHHHPVTGRINNADTSVGGADLQINYNHALKTMPGTLTGGLTARFDKQETDYYKYANYSTIAGRRPGSSTIDQVLSDDSGDRIELQNRDTVLWGLYIQESLWINEKTILDLGLRYDHIAFDISSIATGEYSWSSLNYIDYQSGLSTATEKSYDALSPRVGLSYKLTDWLNTYGSISEGTQTPTEGEINDNPELELVKVRSYEVGFKGRGSNWSIDSAIYYSPVKNEVAKVLQNRNTEYVNAGKTDKKGFELSGSIMLFQSFDIDVGYAYSDYSFKEFSEPVGYGSSAVNMDRSGNQLPFIPENQFSLQAKYKHSSGFKCSLKSKSWSSYYLDNGNTEKYSGYDFVTSGMLGYVIGKVDLTISIDNLFDKRYAIEVTKNTSGVKKYKPAAPRSILARVNYRF